MVNSLLFYGGAFNPPHIGHVALLKAAVEQVSPQLTLVIPSKESPHKQTGKTPFFDRFSMCRCFLSINGVRRSAMEYFMPGKSYTVRTAQRLKKRYPHARLHLLIGADMLTSFTEWREYKTLLELCTLVAGAREGNDEDEISAAAAELEKQGGHVIILKNRPIEISSTEIRAEIAKTGFCDKLPPEVMGYIQKKRLYAGSITPEQARKLAKQRLSPKRYRHSVCVARAAGQLAAKYGEDKTNALIAGYLHDIAKELPKDEMTRLAVHPDTVDIIDNKKIHPVLHSYAGAALAGELGVTDERIIDAIRYHSTGKPGISLFGKIVYVADFISADRKYPQSKIVREAAKISLDKAYEEELAIVYNHLSEKGREILPITLSAIQEMKGNKK